MTAADAPTRPVLRYHGGKWMLAPWIIGHFPPHKVYIEPYGGGASVLLRKPPAFAEIYNDLDGEVVNVFRVMRDPAQAVQLTRLLELTPFARAEFRLSYEPSDDPVEQARRTIVRSFMGYGSDTVTRRSTSGFRARSVRDNVRHAGQDWMNYAPMIKRFTRRLHGVCIESRPALELITMNDADTLLLYLDPPYVLSERYDRAGHNYRHEMTDDDHRELAAVVRGLRAMVVLSGYESDLYRELYDGWRMVRREVTSRRVKGFKNGKNAVECLWLSPNVVGQTSLF